MLGHQWAHQTMKWEGFLLLPTPLMLNRAVKKFCLSGYPVVPYRHTWCMHSPHKRCVYYSHCTSGKRSRVFRLQFLYWDFCTWPYLDGKNKSPVGDPCECSPYSLYTCTHCFWPHGVWHRILSLPWALSHGWKASISLHATVCHLANVGDFYTCFFSASCFHPMIQRLDRLTNPPKTRGMLRSSTGN